MILKYLAISTLFCVLVHGSMAADPTYPCTRVEFTQKLGEKTLTVTEHASTKTLRDGKSGEPMAELDVTYQVTLRSFNQNRQDPDDSWTVDLPPYTLLDVGPSIMPVWLTAASDQRRTVLLYDYGNFVCKALVFSKDSNGKFKCEYPSSLHCDKEGAICHVVTKGKIDLSDPKCVTVSVNIANVGDCGFTLANEKNGFSWKQISGPRQDAMPSYDDENHRPLRLPKP